MATYEQFKTSKGEIRYRVRIRLKQGRDSKNFTSKTSAKEWAKKTEIAMEEGNYFIKKQSQKHNVKYIIEKYKKEDLNHKPKIKDEYSRHLRWWSKEIGDLPLSSITKALLSDKRK